MTTVTRALLLITLLTAAALPKQALAEPEEQSRPVSLQEVVDGRSAEEAHRALQALDVDDRLRLAEEAATVAERLFEDIKEHSVEAYREALAEADDYERTVAKLATRVVDFTVEQSAEIPDTDMSISSGCPAWQARYTNGVTGHGVNLLGRTLLSYNLHIEWCQDGTIQSGRILSATGWTTAWGFQYQYAGVSHQNDATFPGVHSAWVQHQFTYLGGMPGSVEPCLQAMGLIGGHFGHDDGCYLWTP